MAHFSSKSQVKFKWTLHGGSLAHWTTRLTWKSKK